MTSTHPTTSPNSPLDGASAGDRAHHQPFRLLDLPDELWVKIGTMAIDGLPGSHVTGHLKCDPKQPAILQTCASLRSELRLDYFRTKVFINPQMAVLLKHRQKYGEYLHAIGADARQLITIRFNGGWYEPKDFSPEVKKKLKATLQGAWPGLKFKLDSEWIGIKYLKRRWSSKMTQAQFKINTSKMSPNSTTATIRAPSQPFRLLDLPDELWVRIGIMIIEDSPLNRAGSYPHYRLMKPPAILQTCSALRKELRPVYFETKVAITPESRFDLLCHRHILGEFLRTIGAEARRQMEVKFDGGWTVPTKEPPRFPRRELSVLRRALWGVEFKLEGKWIMRDWHWRWSTGTRPVQWTITFL
ncbi:unnamed protein product [Zymoseptoria tritici ST99CH_1A5]|uniref:F-box domain-containing protein n=1 Tax=Zymoseptoria tritici ST99CH_1A5 TaxID=1276529 RepID=A0A1Y6LHS6_ZYMTR|nr:unnamed protein product [Zymoseptoria tritici ST99CH_1A5]